MLDISTTPIARTITLDRGDKKGTTHKRIQEAKLPEHRTNTAEFLNMVFPNQRIEHLSRPDMLCLNHRPGAGFGNVGLLDNLSCDTPWHDLAPSSLFFQSVHAAYARHYALGFRPEVLMYLVNDV